MVGCVTVGGKRLRDTGEPTKPHTLWSILRMPMAISVTDSANLLAASGLTHLGGRGSGNKGPMGYQGLEAREEWERG